MVDRAANAPVRLSEAAMMIYRAILGVALACLLLVSPGSAFAEPSIPTPGERFVPMSDGSSLYVKIAGEGPVCMLVHGGPGQGSLSTEKMGFDALERHLTVVYVDQRGSGRSPDADDYSLTRITRDFEEVRRAIGVDSMCLIAHSFGGILALDYARTHPDRVTALVLANATLHFLGPYNSRMQIDFANDLLGGQAATAPPGDDPAALETALNEARAAVMKNGLGYRFLTRDLDAIKRMGAIDASYPRSRGFGRALFDRRQDHREYFVDHAPLSQRIPHPVLVISSREDYAVGPDEYRRFAFPCQRTMVLDGGHMSYHEQTPAFTAAIARFMRTVTVARGKPPAGPDACDKGP
jgi:proline iminopeptidase